MPLHMKRGTGISVPSKITERNLLCFLVYSSWKLWLTGWLSFKYKTEVLLQYIAISQIIVLPVQFFLCNADEEFRFMDENNKLHWTLDVNEQVESISWINWKDFVNLSSMDHVESFCWTPFNTIILDRPRRSSNEKE